jgi:hypothetical protein
VSNGNVVYDALTMPVFDPGMVFVGFFTSVAFSIVAVVAWIHFRANRAHRSRTDLPKEIQARVATTLMAVGAVGILIYGGVQTTFWRYEYTHHQYAVLDGCIAHFEETVHSDHDLGVDDFTLQGRAFRVSDSGWRVGYHLSHHHGSPLQEGVHLRAFAHGSRLLRIELISDPCRSLGKEAPSRTG